MALLTTLSIFCLVIVVPYVLPEETCAWPDYLDVSVEYGHEIEEFETNSWETRIRIKKNDKRINGKVKNNMWLTILSNDTMEITYNVRKRDLKDRNNKLHYVCAKELEDSTFKVKVIRGRINENNTFIETEPPKYKCVQFIRRSPFVLQWRHGSQNAESLDMLECRKGFSLVNPWPLIHLPVRKLPVWKNLHRRYNQSFPEILNQYQPCPDLGGYHIRLVDKDGNSVIAQCENDPSLRMELECVYGDGVRVTQAESCINGSLPGLGSKLICLATWEDGRYQFSVVVPSYKSGINSFHCLRMNKDDPTQEYAVLFLDTICGKGDVVKTKVHNFQLELRKASIRSICDDTSDQCSAEKCNTRKHSCLSSCSICPANVTLDIDASIRGVWLLQKGSTGRKLNITGKAVQLFNDGIFHAYSNGSVETELCLRDSLTGEEGRPMIKYLLGGVPDTAGCGPRVTTLRAVKVSDGVLLAQIPPPAPLRANLDNSRLDRWCRNNYEDINTYGQLFRPVYPFQSSGGIFRNTSGYLTLINEENQEPVLCMVEDAMKDVLVVATLKSENSTEYHKCEGNFRTADKDKKLIIKLTCEFETSVELKFSCLGRYGIDAGSNAVILKRDGEIPADGLISFQQNYFCLIFPKNAGINSTLLFHTAGECDIVFKTLVEMNVIDPIMALTVGANGSEKAVTELPFLFWLMFSMLTSVLIR